MSLAAQIREDEKVWLLSSSGLYSTSLSVFFLALPISLSGLVEIRIKQHGLQAQSVLETFQ
jgi:hypothetical protein